MPPRPAKRLSEALAQCVVDHCTRCLRRAGVSAQEFAASYPSEGFARAYDTLVLQLEPERPFVAWHPSTQSPAELIREALLLLHALSGCDGYAFYKNFAFWNDTLAHERSEPESLPVSTGMRFPRVVLDWNPRGTWMERRQITQEANLLMFETSVMALFTIPPSQGLSREGKKLMKNVLASRVATPQTTTSPIECVVSIRFAQTLSETKKIVEAVLALTTALTTSSVQSEFMWCGLRIAVSRYASSSYRNFASLGNLRLLRRLCMGLPASVAFDFRLSACSSTSKASAEKSLREQFAALFPATMGIAGTQQHGRLTRLDLRTHWSGPESSSIVDFASLCTLLPLSQTLKTVCVTVTSKEDMLWLAYAATHPLTPTTRWRSLYLEHLDLRNDGEWSPIRRVVGPSLALAALWSEVMQPSTSTVAMASPYTSRVSSVRRTAEIASDVQFFSPDKTKTFVLLNDSIDVELCDTLTPLDELVQELGDPDLDDVAVVVAGVGLGWVHKRHLAQLTDTHYEGRPVSCLTTLVLGSEIEEILQLDDILSFFGPKLVHFSALHVWPVILGSVALACPCLESLATTVAERDIFDEPTIAPTPVMPSLRSVSLICDESLVAASFQWLRSMPQLHTVRIHFEVDEHSECWGEIDNHLKALVMTKVNTLRSITIIHSGAVNPLAFDPGDAIPCDASSKLAFLSVLRGARDKPGSRGAIAQLDSDLARQVFAFAGPSLTRLVAEGNALLPSDWYDAYWSWP